MSLPADTAAQALCHWLRAAVKDCQAQEGLTDSEARLGLLPDKAPWGRAEADGVVFWVC